MDKIVFTEEGRACVIFKLEGYIYFILCTIIIGTRIIVIEYQCIVGRRCSRCRNDTITRNIYIENIALSVGSRVGRIYMRKEIPIHLRPLTANDDTDQFKRSTSNRDFLVIFSNTEFSLLNCLVIV